MKSRGMKCCESSILERIARVAATPGTGTPGTGTPGTATPGTGTPGTATPGTGTPGTGTPGTGTPGTGTNRLLILVALIQKNRRSCCSINRQI